MRHHVSADTVSSAMDEVRMVLWKGNLTSERSRDRVRIDRLRADEGLQARHSEDDGGGTHFRYG